MQSNFVCWVRLETCPRVDDFRIAFVVGVYFTTIVAFRCSPTICPCININPLPVSIRSDALHCTLILPGSGSICSRHQTDGSKLPALGSANRINTPRLWTWRSSGARRCTDRGHLSLGYMYINIFSTHAISFHIWFHFQRLSVTLDDWSCAVVSILSLISSVKAFYSGN